jgi:hypothetical protein
MPATAPIDAEVRVNGHHLAVPPRFAHGHEARVREVPPSIGAFADQFAGTRVMIARPVGSVHTR